MELTQKSEKILEVCRKNTSCNPIAIFKEIVAMECINMHGPEHHIIDGASILTAYHNAGGKIELDEALSQLAAEGMKMPGAICGKWGVCGAVLSVGCAIAIIDGTGPVSTDGSWGKHMEYSAKAVERIGKTYGPRCCKRDGFIALKTGVEYINANMDVKLESEGIECVYSEKNQQCIHEKCPFYGKTK